MKVRDLGDGAYAFYCPGCEHEHIYYTGDHRPIKARWDFNGDLNNPSFTPSLLNRWGVNADGGWNPEFEDGTDHTKPPYSGICHLYVTNGVINYCGDCTHSLNGQQNVPMKEY